jgi:hypothetical protein
MYFAIVFAIPTKNTGGGRNPISPRLLRHFNLICFADFDDATLTRIFDTIGM